MNLPSNDQGQQILKDYYQLSDLIQKKNYTSDDRNLILQLMRKYPGLSSKDNNNDFIRLNEVRGHLMNASHSTVQAHGRDEWIGWFELYPSEIKATAIENTARVINAVNSDILCIVEVENRVAINKFNENVIPQVGGEKYKHTMVIDGNDGRGIDVGIMTRSPFEIDSIGTHVDDFDDKGIIFSRDCAEYTIKTALGNPVLLLVNHFKSQSGDAFINDPLRKRQAKRVREIYEEKLRQGHEFIAITGDFNINPSHDSLKPLLGNGSNLLDITKHPKFKNDGLSWTYKRGHLEGKLDYILLSPKLQDKIQQAGIERHGVWVEENDNGGFEHFPEVKGELDAASDHAALWVDIDI